MIDEAVHVVALYGQPIGRIHQRGDVARFVFDEDYWTRRGRPVLGLWFENNPRESPQAALRLPEWFSNLLPEGPLRTFIARDQRVSVQRELQLLLRIGSDLPGAVTVIPDPDGRVNAELLAQAREAQSSPSTASPYKFSLAGVAMKFSMLRSGDRLTIPAQGELGREIVKLPMPGYPDVPANEFATMRLAGAVGIDVPTTGLVHRDQLPPLPDLLWPNGEVRAYTVHRFDRADGDERIHIEDFAQVRGKYSDAKYEGALETVASFAYRGTDLRALQEFTRRLTFMLLVGNGDAHLKNWSLIYPDRRVPTLSPAYDLVSTAPYYPADAPEDLGLRFGGTTSFTRVRRASFTRLEKRLHLPARALTDIVDETCDRFVEAFGKACPAEMPEPVRAWISHHHPGVVRNLLA